MMRPVTLAFLAVLLVSTGVLWQPEADAQPDASRVIDRTVLCATDPAGGIYEIEIRTNEGFRSGRGAWEKPATGALTTGSTGSAAQALDNSLAWVIAGRPKPKATVIPDPFTGFTYPIRTWGNVAMSVRCRPSRVRVPLTTAGLEGGRPGQLGEQFDCPTPRRVLVRTRAVLQSPTTLTRHRQFLVARTPVLEGYLAVRTESGRPIAYAETFASGKARLFTAPRCLPD
jgi:hypothetical protein